MVEFAGFPKAAFEYLAALEANNNKAWFDENRASYDQDLIAPALDFVAAMAPVVSSMSPSYQAVPKMNGSLRRLHRDLRFSKDKTPFNPRLHLVFWHGKHPNRAPAVHFVLHGDGLGLGVGQWSMTPAELAAYRAAVANATSRGELHKALSSAYTVGATVQAPSLARLPKGFETIGEEDNLLQRKGLVALTEERLPIPDELLGPEAIAYATGVLKALAPVSDWLIKHTAP